MYRTKYSPPASCMSSRNSRLVLNLTVTIVSKPPTQSQKFKTLQKLILAYFHNVIHILSQITDNDLLQLAVTESTKIIPYIVSSRKAVKLYLQVCPVLVLYSLTQFTDLTEVLGTMVERPGQHTDSGFPGHQETFFSDRRVHRGSCSQGMLLSLLHEDHPNQNPAFLLSVCADTFCRELI